MQQIPGVFDGQIQLTASYSLKEWDSNPVVTVRSKVRVCHETLTSSSDSEPLSSLSDRGATSYLYSGGKQTRQHKIPLYL